MVSPPADVDLGKLSYEMFSLLLGSKFLFGESVPGTLDRTVLDKGEGRPSTGRSSTREKGECACSPSTGAGQAPATHSSLRWRCAGVGGMQAAMLFP
jgi:hypothetical protein